MNRSLPFAVASVVALATGLSSAAPGQGTLTDPIVVDAFPYVLASTTTGAPSSVIDSYDCSSSSDESGPERVFKFSLSAAARVTAWVEGDAGSVDVDVHLLDDLTLSGAQSTSCLARGNKIAEADMSAGEHFVVVDSFDGAAQAGDFVLHLYAIGDAWVETPVADGVVWRARRFANLSGGQVIHHLVVTPGTPGVSVKATGADGCQTVSSIGGSIPGAVAGVNGGFFVMNSTCPPVSMLKVDGVLKKSNDMDRGSFGISPAGLPLVEMIAEGADWPGAFGAHGGGPMLVVDAKPNKGQATWAAQGFSSTSWNGVNPRTVAGIDPLGNINFFTADGRESPVAEGLSLDDLAAFAAGPEMGLVDVVNLDGGGSTTFWIAGATPNGVVNYPSGGGVDNPTHGSQRAVSGGFFVIAPPYNHAPRFQTQPLSTAQAGAAYQYDADAIDLDVGDVVTFAIDKGPTGMQVDPKTGVVTWQPEASSPNKVDVTLLASDQKGLTTPQSWTLAIDGATGAGGAGGAGGSDAGQSDATSPADGGTTTDAPGAGGTQEGGTQPAFDGGGAYASAEEDGGCTCASAGRPVSAAWWTVLAALTACLRRRGSSRRRGGDH